MADTWYFAYGSNLDPVQKEDRSGPIREVRVVRLDGYRIAFNKHGRDGTAKANLMPEPSSSVWGVVYLCSPEALRAMDEWEGVAGGHYLRKQVTVEARTGELLEAVTYEAGESFVTSTLPPSAEYVARILDGARRQGLPDEHLLAIEVAAAGDSRSAGPGLDRRSR